jgi:hypothetical protein
LEDIMKIAIFAAALATAALTMPAPGHAAEYKWCAQYGGRDGGGGRNCGFSTLAQCRATVSGIGGYCEVNPRYAGNQRRTRSTTGSAVHD